MAGAEVWGSICQVQRIVNSLRFLEEKGEMQKTLERTPRSGSDCEQPFKLLLRIIKVFIIFAQQW